MLLLSCLLATSCFEGEGTSPDEAAAALAQAPASQEIVSGPVRFMRMHPKRDAILAAANAPGEEVERIASFVPAAQPHLTYFGGPVMSHAKVVQVNWNANVRFQSELSAFYAAITNSRHMDWLVEYATPTQTIGRGSFLTSVVDPQPPTGTTITDAKIQQELQRLISAGTVPPPDSDTIYMVHFPSGIKITQGGQSSCQAFCAYHGSFTATGGTRAIYGVIPDMSGGCASGCGSSTAQNNTQVCASHELIEAVTDPAVAEATTNGPPLGWYDNTNGEVGDICAAEEGTVDGIYVQSEWSNALNDCILKNDAVPPPTTNPNTFSLSVTPASQTVVAGNSASYTVTTAVTSGTAESVALTVTGLPTGATASISPTSVQAGSTATITVNTVVSAPAATATLAVKGVAASSTVNGSATLKITAFTPPTPDAAPPPPPTPDAAVPPPVGQPDAGEPPPVGQPDAGGTPETPGDGGATGGCGCSVGGAEGATSGPAGALAALAVLGGLVLVGRRRRRA